MLLVSGYVKLDENNVNEVMKVNLNLGQIGKTLLLCALNSRRHCSELLCNTKCLIQILLKLFFYFHGYLHVGVMWQRNYPNEARRSTCCYPLFIKLFSGLYTEVKWCHKTLWFNEILLPVFILNFSYVLCPWVKKCLCIQFLA